MLASLSDTDHVAQQRSSTRRWLCRELECDGRRYIPSEANFVMIDVGGDVASLIPKFRECNILVGRKFSSLGNWLHISIGTQKDVEKFLSALRAIVPASSSRAASRPRQEASGEQGPRPDRCCASSAHLRR